MENGKDPKMDPLSLSIRFAKRKLQAIASRHPVSSCSNFLQDVFGTYGYVRAESLFAVLVYPFIREWPELIFRMFSAFETVSVRAETAVTFHPSNGSTKMLAKLGVVWTI
jgi:hypothetical protein